MTKREDRVVGRTGSSVEAELSQMALRQLLTGEVACIWHRQWYDVTEIRSELQKLYDLGVRSVPDGTGVRSIGPQVGSAFISESAATNYFAEAQIFWKQVRTEIFAAFVNPIDALSDSINDIWPAGATAGRRGNETFSPGVFRWFSQGSSLNPHVDTVTESLIGPLCNTARLAANIYLDTTSTINGGHLELWDLSLTREQFERVRAPDFSLRREMIAPPALSISPEPGDLILIDAERIHAVSTILNGTRLTASTFVGFSRLDRPLFFFA